ncbi:extended synaptotagmin-3 isoform X6 [Balaenoptera musculus]|uniref:Extended synaptotagmin-3 isoform X6 n=1 Tax=Balaenoptera musculus TaxID=9771 RepID=A0A8B8X9G9_BALMU|nr:extended synaptotagmin-3 isoform X6 [Balaenoptera musculus]
MPAEEPCAPGAPGARGTECAPGPEPCLSSQLLPELYTFAARVLFYLTPVYLAGYLGISFTWLLLGALGWMWWRRNRRGKLGRLAAAFEFLNNERQFISRELRGQHLPAWIHFPDVERVEWANKIISQIWPYLSVIMENKFREKLEPKIQEKNVHLRTFTFTKLYFGQKYPRINGIKVHTNQCNRRQVVLDLQICYIGDCEISVELQKIQAGVNGIQLQGTLRVILEPLLVDKPFVGAVTMFFLQKPHLQINWTGLTNLLDAPGINEMSDSLLEDLIAAHLVLPNRVTVPVKKGLDLTNLRFPLPCGVIRVHLLEAEKLAQKDNFLGHQGKSDPYAKVRIGLQHFRSRTIHKNLNPTWNEVFEFTVYEVPGQDLEVDLYDEDPDKDDFLGSLQICLGDVMTNRVVDEWFALKDTRSGQLHLRLEWLSLITDPEAVMEFLHLEERELGSPYTGPEALKKGPLLIKKAATNQGPRAPPQGKGPADLPCPRDPVSDIKQASKSTTATTSATKPTLQEMGPEPKGKDRARGFCAPMGEKKSVSTIFLAVPGPHCPGPVKSPRPMKCPASLFAWPPKRLASSMSSLNSLASSCFDLTDVSLNTEDEDLRHQGLGEIQLTVRYVCLQHCLSVLINGCRNLMPCSSSGADPYVRVYLLPERRWASRKKTSVKRKTLDPLFDETFEFFVPLDEVKKRSLDVAVKNSRPLGSHRRKELGKVLIDLSKEDLNKGFSQWYELTPDGQPRN